MASLLVLGSADVFSFFGGEFMIVETREVAQPKFRCDRLAAELETSPAVIHGKRAAAVRYRQSSVKPPPLGVMVGFQTYG